MAHVARQVSGLDLGPGLFPFLVHLWSINVLSSSLVLSPRGQTLPNCAGISPASPSHYIILPYDSKLVREAVVFARYFGFHSSHSPDFVHVRSFPAAFAKILHWPPHKRLLHASKVKKVPPLELDRNEAEFDFLKLNRDPYLHAHQTRNDRMNCKPSKKSCSTVHAD